MSGERKNIWKAWRGMSTPERRVVATASWNAVVIGTRLRLRGFRSTKVFVDGPSSNSRGPVALARVAEITGRVLHRVPWSPNCLERSLVLMRVIHQFGVEAQLRFGVRTRGGGLEFHAWVEADGDVVGDREDIDSLFTPFSGDAIPPTAVFV